MGEMREFQLPGGSGLKCEKCGAWLTRVHRTLTTAGFITRERICPECQTLNTTSERVINARKIRGRFSDPCEGL